MDTERPASRKLSILIICNNNSGKRRPFCIKLSRSDELSVLFNPKRQRIVAVSSTYATACAISFK